MVTALTDPWWTVVMVAGGRRFTCTLDASDKAERYLSATGETVRESALGRLSAAEGGVRLTPLGSSTLLLEDGSEAEELLLAAGSATATATLTDARTGEACIVYLRSCDPGARRFHKMALTGDCELLIGGDEGCQLRYASRWVSQRHAELRCRSGVFTVRDLGSTNGTFVNGALLAGGASRQLAPGDVVQVLDLCVQVGRGFLSLNAPQGLTEALEGLAVPIRHAELVQRAPEATPADRIPAQREFWPAPRVVRSVQRRAYNVEEPPAVHKPDDSPAIMKMGPSFLMGLASIFMAASAVSRIMGGADVLSSAPSIAMCVSMMGGMVLWPLIARRYERRKAVREEAHRRSAYSDYLAALERTFIKDGREQSAILRENRVDARTCLGWVHGRDERLMGRGPRDADFMQLRVGTGTLPLEADFRWPETRFSLDADDLVEMARRLSDRPPMLEDVPVAADLLEDRTLGVAGDPASRWALARSLVLQAAALYAPTDVRIAAIVGEGERDEWDFLAQLPHTLSADGRMRLVATDAAGVRELGALLAREAAGRRGGAEGGRCLLLCSDRGLWEASDVVADLLEAEKDLGVSLVFLAPDVAGLPSETVRVAEVGPREGRLYAREDASSTLVDLVMDAPVVPAEAARAASALARVGLGAGDAAFALPSSLGFLEMYGVRDAADLSVGARWERADASRSLAAPFGVDARGMPAVLDPHEAFDGPHGLVAGTTGSGKSELLVSWILSTCVAFPPEQASFVLVDYKGGGLADAFSREGAGLPHLAGTVTNLDGAEVARSLASIRAELVRRQRMLAGAKRATGDATMDVSSYQRHWAAGDVAEPMPHLFVVADEFAELKQQEPEFLDALVSAARIGRSLGVHLVLATQRPTGVVTDQIQANSRFRACLRVADAADSKEMVRRPDAAALEGAGRLILLVGYDERLLQAQAAWAGGPYDPSGAGGDRAVEAAGSPGAPLAALQPAAPAGARAAAGLTELDAVLGELRRAAGGRAARRLWLDPLEPHPTVEALRSRYPNARSGDAPWELDPLVGELDDPARQEKRALTLPLSREGNVAIYGHASSGKEDLAVSLLWNMLDVDPDEACAYVVDAGAGALLAFGGAPQVPDAMPANDAERVSNLFKYLRKTMSDRRAALGRGYAGLDDYNAQHEGADRMYSIAVVLNGVAELFELVPSVEDRLDSLMREGPRYGIHFVLLADTQRDVRFRMRANVGQSLVMALADESDYLAILGSIRGAALPEGNGRGLVRQGDDLYMFQCAYACGEGVPVQAAISERVADEIDRWGSTATRRVPTLPEVLTPSLLPRGDYGSGLPVGIMGDDFMPVVLGRSREHANLVCATQAFQCIPFMQACAAVAHERGWDVVIVDPAGILGAVPWWAVSGPAAMTLGSHEGDGGKRLVLVPDARSAFDGPAEAQLASAVCDGGRGDMLLLAAASASDLNAIQAHQWGQRLMFRNGVIWLGPGLASAYALQVVTPASQLRENMGEGGGCYIRDAQARPSKFVAVSDDDWGP